ncbi:hypothetical protein, partial [uncultured Algibacter sp.]|uniref:hypothetical protein n=1 Tax=uncultured Algibacter sp. TaxID=298659 RepID=UPI00321747E7
MRVKLIKLKICLVLFLIFTIPNLRAQEQTQKASKDKTHTEFSCGHVHNKSLSANAKLDATTSKVLNSSNIGKQPVLGDLDFLIIRTNFVGGTVEDEFKKEDADIFMAALDSYIKRLSYNKTSVKSYEVTDVFQSKLTSADIKGDLNKVTDEMKKLAREAGHRVNNRLVYLVMDGPNLELGPGGAFGIGNGIDGTSWWPSNLNVETHGAGWSHETFHMFGIGHLGLIETTDKTSYPGSRNTRGVDPYHFMGTEGGLTRWDASKPREALTGQLPIPNKVRLGWLSEDNLVVTPGTSNQKIRFNITDGTDSNLGNKKIGVIVNGHDKTFSLGYYKNLEKSSDRLDQRGGILVHEWDQGFFARTFLLDAHPNSVDGSPDPRRQTDAWKSVFEFTDAAIRVGETMNVGDLFKIKVESEGGSGNDRWVEVSIITDAGPDTNAIGVDLNATEYNYDLGTPASPVQSGWQRISEKTNGD